MIRRPAPSPEPTAEAAPDDGRPQVALPNGGMPTWVIALLSLAIALVFMLALNGGRDRVQIATRAYDGPGVPPLPPSLAAGSESLLGGAQRAGPDGSFAVRVGAFRQAAPFAAPIRAAEIPPFAGPSVMPSAGYGASSEGMAPAGMRFPTEPMPGAPAPGTSTTLGMGGRGMGTGGTALVYDASGAASVGGLGDEKGGETASARASLIRNRPMVVAQGEILPATLETPVSSARPGPIRALVARDVRGFDGSRVLIPRGSRLIGEYRADPAAGRRRVLATWTRLIRPDGVAIRIDSPAADSVGASGIPGRVDTHFLARFANAALQSALQIGVNLASRAGDGSVIVANTPQISGVMGGPIIPGADEPPTVSVRAGAAISVFVARDLDFTGVPAAR